MVTFVVIFWVLCAGFSSYIASQKNREPVAWFFVGLIFGVFGLVAIAAVPSIPKPDPLPEGQPEDEGWFRRTFDH